MKGFSDGPCPRDWVVLGSFHSILRTEDDSYSSGYKSTMWPTTPTDNQLTPGSRGGTTLYIYQNKWRLQASMGMLKFYRGKSKPKHLHTHTQDRPKKELPNLDAIGGYLAVLITITPVTCYLTPDACIKATRQRLQTVDSA